MPIKLRSFIPQMVMPQAPAEALHDDPLTTAPGWRETLITIGATALGVLVVALVAVLMGMT